MSQASNLSVYAPLFVSINGSFLQEEASVTVNRDAGLQDVNTTMKGWAGVSLGAAKAEVTIESNIPVAGFENPGPLPLDQLLIGVTPVAFVITPNQQTQLSFNGFLKSIDVQHSVGSPSKVTIRATGSFSVFQ